MEWLSSKRPKTPVTHAVFDFDGTISTLRSGWEGIMGPFMVEMIEGDGGPDDGIRELVKNYINESAGVQTIFQMKWLAQQVKTYGRNPIPYGGPWEYKAEYNRRLMEPVTERRRLISEGVKKPGDFMISGSADMLETLRERGLTLYVASGTDDADVKKEAGALGLTGYFAEIKGAPEGREDCSKEALIRGLINGSGVPGDRIAVVGDGKVEIMVGRDNGARTLGLATDEERRGGVNPIKRERLIKAGADAIAGDFTETEELMEFFFGKERQV